MPSTSWAPCLPISSTPTLCGRPTVVPRGTGCIRRATCEHRKPGGLIAATTGCGFIPGFLLPQNPGRGYANEECDSRKDRDDDREGGENRKGNDDDDDDD